MKNRDLTIIPALIQKYASYLREQERDRAGERAGYGEYRSL